MTLEATMLSVQNLAKSYGDGAWALGGVDVGGVDLEVARGEFHTLLGPSGCGKTTLLRSIAGLERPDRGSITLSGKQIFDADRGVHVTPDRRGLGMVFQSYAIWPHMDVFKNVAFPLTVGTKVSRAERTRRVTEALEVVGLDHLASRPATNLSGGQQQRLAVARALVTRPDLVLLDEPLSNLDAALRETMRFELKRLQRETGVTMVYVTHDQAEALALSDVVTVMSAGQVEQSGPPREIYDRPSSLFVARFVGAPNLIPGVVEYTHGGGARVASELGPIEVAECAAPTGATVRVLLRPADLRIQPADAVAAAEGTVFDAVVTDTVFEGDRVRHRVQAGAVTVECHSDRHEAFPAGTPVRLTTVPHRVRVVPEQHEVAETSTVGV